MRALTPKEKINLLNSTTTENMHELKEFEIHGIVNEDESHRVGIRFDMRNYILDKLKENNISQRTLAFRVGINPQNLNAYLKRNSTIPLTFLEEILWILQDDNIYTDENIDNTRIIKKS